jgi:hypothetical protein
MGCAIGCLALFFPRLTLFLVWLLGGDYLARAYDSWIWLVLGFIFFPLTTLAFAFGLNTLGQPEQMEPLSWLIVAIALLCDIGALGGNGAHARRRRRDRDREERALS